MTEFILNIMKALVILNFPLFILLSYLPKDYHLDGSDIILNYQLEKLNKSKSLKIGFFGDSSCGNAIDASVFGEQSLNLSLVGAYNLSGTLKMIKKTHQSGHKLDTAIIIHTLDVFSRKNNLDEKFEKNYSYNEIFRRKFKIFIKKLINSDHKYLFMNKNMIENDYLMQNKDQHPIKVQNNFILDEPLSAKNMNIIDSIVEYCNEQEIVYLFLIGPNVNILQNENYNSILKFFRENNYNFSNNFYDINSDNVGDGNDHVRYSYKLESSKFYKDQIRKFFKKKSKNIR